MATRMLHKFRKHCVSVFSIKIVLVMNLF